MKKSEIELKYPKGQTARLQKAIYRLKISVIFGCIMLVAVYASNINFARAARLQVENMIYLNQYRNASKTLTSSARSYVVTKEEVYYNAYYQELNEDKNRENALEMLEKNALAADEMAILNEINTLSNNLVPIEEEAMELARDGDLEQAEEYLFGESYEEKAALISQQTSEVIVDILNRLERNKSVSRGLQFLFDVLFFASFVLIVYEGAKTIHFSEKEILEPVIGVSEQMNQLAAGNLQFSQESFVADSEVGQMICSIEHMKKNLTLMIREIAEVLEKAGDGDYRIQLEQEYVGDFIQIKDSIQRISEKMRDSLQTIQIVCSEVNSGAENLTSAADGLANACTSQAGQVSDIMILIGELREAISSNEKQAEEAVKISKSSEEMLQENQTKLVSLQETIKDVTACADEMIHTVEKIEEITSETDMLSLNAAIEAARAGEQGKGFSVVAEQVKRLAENSARATQETSELIYKTMDAIKRVSTLANDSNNNMEEVILGSNETSERLENIVSRLQKEVENIARLDENVSEVAGIVDNNSATSEETAAISQEQQAQVETLTQLLQNYKV